MSSVVNRRTVESDENDDLTAFMSAQGKVRHARDSANSLNSVLQDPPRDSHVNDDVTTNGMDDDDDLVLEQGDGFENSEGDSQSYPSYRGSTGDLLGGGGAPPVIIEPAGADEEDYGDYGPGSNNGTDIGDRPFIRLNAGLRDIDFDTSKRKTIKLKCEIHGTLPIKFRWFKNNAPVQTERNRVTIRYGSYSTVLRIRRPTVRDTAYYRCEGHNAAPKTAMSEAKVVVFDDPAQRPPVSSSAESFFPGSDDAGLGGLGHGSSSLGDPDGPRCVAYTGEICRPFIDPGSPIYISDQSDASWLIQREKMLISALSVIANSSDVTPECKQVAAKVSCLNVFAACRRTVDVTPVAPGDVTARLTKVPICRRDCEHVEREVCPREYEEAKRSGLMNPPLSIFPHCETLPEESSRLSCISLAGDKPTITGGDILQLRPGVGGDAIDADKTGKTASRGLDGKGAGTGGVGKGSKDEHTAVNPVHLCYHGSGAYYRGAQHTSVANKACVSWQKQSKYPVDRYPELAGNSYCRNPGGTRPRPWCYTAAQQPGVLQEEYCQIEECPEGMLPQMALLEKNAKVVPPGSGSGSINYAQYLIIGGAVFGLLLLSVMIALIYYCCRSRSPTSSTVTNGHKNSANGGPNHHQQHANNHMLGGGGMGYSNGHLLNGGMGRNKVTNGDSYHNQHNPTGYDEQVELLPFLPPTPGTIVGPPEIPAQTIRCLDEVGFGEFGTVWKGELVGYPPVGDEPYPVAIKMLQDDAGVMQRRDFQREADIAARFHHRNVIELIGVCMGTRPNCMVFEYMMHGDLHEFLELRSPFKHVQPDPADNDRLAQDQIDGLLIAQQIASGMSYLASFHYVHRDIATRNCLVTDHMTIKISDFGLARDIYASDYYQVQSHAAKMPVRWMPPEAIIYGKFSEESDVWSFGVTLWEIYTYGLQPYADYANSEVIEMIRNRCLLECPTNCPPRMYSMMVECWHEKPGRRPRFSELHGRLQTLSMVSSPPASGMGPAGQMGGPRSAISGVSGGPGSSLPSSHHSSSAGPLSNQTATTGVSNGVGGYHNFLQHQHHYQPNGHQFGGRAAGGQTPNSSSNYSPFMGGGHGGGMRQFSVPPQPPPPSEPTSGDGSYSLNNSYEYGNNSPAPLPAPSVGMNASAGGDYYSRNTNPVGSAGITNNFNYAAAPSPYSPPPNLPANLPTSLVNPRIHLFDDTNLTGSQPASFPPPTTNSIGGGNIPGGLVYTSIDNANFPPPPPPPPAINSLVGGGPLPPPHHFRSGSGSNGSSGSPLLSRHQKQTQQQSNSSFSNSPKVKKAHKPSNDSGNRGRRPSGARRRGQGGDGRSSDDSSSDSQASVSSSSSANTPGPNCNGSVPRVSRS